MSIQTVQRLTVIESMLVTTAQRYALACQRLAEVQPGFPPSTPGAGEPGGGSGSHSSITERSAGIRRPELDKARYIEHAPLTIADIITTIVKPLNIPRPEHANSLRYRRDLIVWSWWATRQLVEHPDVVRGRDLERLDRAVTNLHRVVKPWGTPAATPKKAVDDLDALPTDLTGDLCRSCLRVGSRSMRYRGELCGWCYEIACALRAAVHGASSAEVAPIVPPMWIMEARRDSRKITEQMFLTAVKAEREKLKPKGKRRKAR